MIKGLSNTDCQDFTDFVRRFISYLKDSNFDQFDYSQVIGKMNEYDISVRRCEEYYGSETPYTTRFYAETLGFKFEMPLVRYGISDENVAYIHSIQRKRLYNNKSCRIKKINCLFNTVNKGIKDNRDITPSMLCSLAIFMGMLRSNGITEIRADGFLTRRYGHYNGITDDDERDEVSFNCVEKFIKLFMRIVSQFDGIEITSLPFDVDSYIHIKIGDNVHSDNELLNNLYNVGLNFPKEEAKVKRK